MKAVIDRPCVSAARMFGDVAFDAFYVRRLRSSRLPSSEDLHARKGRDMAQPPNSRRLSAKSPKLPWGWIEWTLVITTMIPAVLLIPGMRRVRIVTRIAVFVVPLLAWAALGLRGKGGFFGTYKPARWLIGCLIWMTLMLVHPGSEILSGIAQIVLTFSVVSPAFWAESALRSPRRIARCMTILLVCNAASAAVGLGQVFRPGFFSPPEMAINVGQEDMVEGLKIEVNGQKVFRPSGLTDSPGGAAVGGMVAAILAIAWVLRPIAWWKKIICLGITFVGLAAIYFAQTRVMLLNWIGVTGVLMGLLFLQRDIKRVTILAIAAGAMFAASLAWVAATGGAAVMKRFEMLTQEDASSVYYNNRGGFVATTFEVYLPEAPLGYGIGRWGMMCYYFADASLPLKNSLEGIWVEVQITGWAVNGGVPLLLLNLIAIGVSFHGLFRILMRFRRKDEELAYWASVVFAMNAGVVVMCFGNLPFVGVIGMQFWLFAAMMQAAARLREREPIIPPTPPKAMRIPSRP